MRQYAFCILLLVTSSISAETEPDSFSQEAQERKKYLDPGIGVQDHFINEALSKEFCDFILLSAPKEIVDKIKLMANPICPAELKPKRIILVGPSGSGKTTLAQVMGYLSFRPVVFINAGMLGNEFKNSAVQNLRRVVEPYVNKNPDADLPKQVWEMFDICAQFPGITLIGITNDISGMPDPLKTRLAGDIIEVPMIDSLERRKEIFDYYLNKITHECDENEVSSIARKTKKLSHRELEKVVIEAYAGAFLRNQIYPKIKIEDLEKAFEKIQKSRKLLNQINWKKYEKPFQYGIQISGVLVSCIGIAVSTYMAALSLKVSMDSYKTGLDGLAYSKQHGIACLAQNAHQFEENYKLNASSLAKNERRVAEGQLLQKMYAVLSRFIQHDGFHMENDYVKTGSFSNDRIHTEPSAGAYKIYLEGRDVLTSINNGTFDQLVDKILKEEKV
jgi:ABC-type dipeptide/oligopeptide/nickel transport system ATPase component